MVFTLQEIIIKIGHPQIEIFEKKNCFRFLLTSIPIGPNLFQTKSNIEFPKQNLSLLKKMPTIFIKCFRKWNFEKMKTCLVNYLLNLCIY